MVSLSPLFNSAKSEAESVRMGIGREYISSATIEARAKNESTLVVIIAAGAVLARTASKRTAVVVEDPRENGTANIRPAAFSPDNG